MSGPAPWEREAAPPPAPPETSAERAETRATRRRWVTLAELVAVGGLLLGALTFYTGWADRRADQADKVAEAQHDRRDKARFELRGTVADDGRLIRFDHDEAHALGDVRLVFPTALGVAPQDAVGHAIDADWIARPLLKLTDGGADERSGRLPVLVTYRYTAGEDDLTGTAIFDLIWQTRGRMLRGRSLKLADFRLRERGGTPARLDALWAREKPAPG